MKSWLVCCTSAGDDKRNELWFYIMCLETFKPYWSSHSLQETRIIFS